MRRTAIVLLSSCLFAVTACTGGESPSTPSAPSEADVVAWMDKVCGAVDSAAQTTSDDPPIDLTDQEKLKSGLSGWLGTRVAAAEKSAGDLQELENGPHPRSAELAGMAKDGVEQLRTLLSDTKTALDASADATGAIAAFTKMSDQLAAMESIVPQVRRKLDETGLAEVARKAGNCQQLQAPPTPTP